MALAKLCSMLGQHEIGRNLHCHFHAFIVDHKAREGSREEALSVRENLVRIGMF